MENNKYTKEDYNNEPVHSCTHCKSLHIKILDNSDIDYCVNCGNTDIKVSSIDQWLEEKEAFEKKDMNMLRLDDIINGIISK